MKRNTIYISLLFVAFMITACDKNEIMPSFETKGTATQTVASIVASKTSPVASETITLTMKYINPSSDPVSQIVLRAKVGAADYVDVQTFNESSAAKDSEVTRTADFVAPASGTTVIFDMVISSTKVYPQVKRTTIKVK